MGLLCGACGGDEPVGREQLAAQAEETRTPGPLVGTNPLPENAANPLAATPVPAPDVEAAPVETAKLWYPHRDSLEMVAVMQKVGLAQNGNEVERIEAVVAAWIEADGVADERLMTFAQRDDLCPQTFGVDVTAGVAEVAICPADISDPLIEALRRTVSTASAGGDVVVLHGDGLHCVAPISPTDDPWPCLSHLDESSGRRCPLGPADTRAIVSGVDEWVNSRLAPSLSAPVVTQIPVGAELEVNLSTLRPDAEGLWWVTVRLPEHHRCASVAARFLTSKSVQISDVAPGVGFVFPATGVWRFQPPSTPIDAAVWQLEGTFATTISVQVLRGRWIDERLAAQLERFESEDYEFPEDWYRELSVTGADRAVRPVYTISGSGDIGVNEIWVEAGDFTLVAATSVYAEDLDTAPFDELEAFLTSITVDRDELADAFASAGE